MKDKEKEKGRKSYQNISAPWWTASTLRSTSLKSVGAASSEGVVGLTDNISVLREREPKFLADKIRLSRRLGCL
jgi:hypothetical protein